MIVWRRTALSFAAILFGALSARAQGNTTQRMEPMARDANPAFEVAVIKLADPDDRNQRFSLSGHRIVVEDNTLTSIICFAYSIQKTQIVNAPQWFDEQSWNIEGVPDIEGVPNWLQYREMLQKLLATRFGLVVRHEKRELSVYAVTVAKGGPKLEKSKSDPTAMSDQSGHGVGAGAQYMKFTNDSMADFAQTMELMVDKPVVDRTNLAGRYDFSLLWTQNVMAATPTDAAPSLFTAIQEQLGLKLEATRASTDVLVVDAATLPTQN